MDGERDTKSASPVAAAGEHDTASITDPARDTEDLTAQLKEAAARLRARDVGDLAPYFAMTAGQEP